MSDIRNSRAPGATSRVILGLKPFEISIRGPIGSEPSVGRITGKMSRNSNTHVHSKKISILQYHTTINCLHLTWVFPFENLKTQW